jgi:hypothetical protein
MAAKKSTAYRRERIVNVLANLEKKRQLWREYDEDKARAAADIMTELLVEFKIDKEELESEGE